MLKQSCLTLLIFLLVQGCNFKKTSGDETKDNVPLTDKDKKTKILYAKGFTIDYFDDFKLVSIINPFERQNDTIRYILQKKGAPKINRYPDAQRIEIPVEKMVATSSTHIALLELLGSENVLTGLASTQYVYSPKVTAMVKAGQISEIGVAGGLNEEKIVEMAPDLVMTIAGPDGRIDHYPTLEQAGIPFLINSEWVEKTPLARAEWLKLIAALLDKEDLANEKFEKIATEYNRLVSLAAASKNKPTVLSGLNTKDAWFMPGGDGYMAVFLKDSGADYPWKNTKTTTSLPLSFEAVYPKALQADYWINVGFDPSDSRRTILAQDARYADFNAFKSGKMYSYNNRVNASGANDFFESGNINPHIVLSDLIKIFHPELLPDHQLVYYKQIH